MRIRDNLFGELSLISFGTGSKSVHNILKKDLKNRFFYKKTTIKPVAMY